MASLQSHRTITSLFLNKSSPSPDHHHHHHLHLLLRPSTFRPPLLSPPPPSLRFVVASSVTDSANASSGGGGSKKKGSSVPQSNYVVPLDKSFSSSYITRPLVEILRDLNKRIPDNVINDQDQASTFIPWYHANRMLSFYAPGWCGEIRDVIFSDNGSVTVVYRVTIRGSDGEAHRESTGTVSSTDGQFADPVAAAEEIAFCKACARFGLGLYLYHEE